MNRRPQVLIAHPGTQYSPRLAAELHRHGVLGRYATGFAVPDNGWLGAADRLAPSVFRRSWSNRCIKGVPAGRLSLFPRLEWQALQRIRRGEPAEQVLFERNVSFQRSIPEQWISEASSVIGFDTSSWLLADRCKRMGRPFVLDQSIGHPRAKEQVYDLVRERYPDWIARSSPKPDSMLTAEASEHSLADRIVVASAFSKRTLVASGVSADKVSLVPYGVDLNRFTTAGRKEIGSRPLRFLFVGLLNARKGVPVLLDAWRRLGVSAQSELWLVGHASAHERSLIGNMSGVRLLGRRPHHELPALFGQCDVFVFPSFFEGFGLVLLEAMASGLPVIATDATAAPDLFITGDEGRVVSPGDIEALAAVMKWYLDAPERARDGGWSARQCAEKYSWEDYGNRWMGVLAEAQGTAVLA